MGYQPTLSGLKECDSIMLVSIIIPVYNVAPYLNEALDSVVNQSYQHLEILIIDDGSQDDSGQICDEYSKKDERIRVIHQENKGLSTARNVGLNLMTGDAVAFLDADDAYDPDYVKIMIEALIREKADCVVCRFTIHRTSTRMIITGTEKIVPRIKSDLYDRATSLRAIVDGRINISTWNKMYRRELWNDIRFPDGHVFEEQKTILEIFNLCNKIYVLNQPLYRYRIRKDSISNTFSDEYLKDLIAAYSYVEVFVSKHTPEVFSVDIINMVRKVNLNNLIAAFHMYYRVFGNEWQRLELLRSQIIKTEKSIKGKGLKTAVACRLITYCPQLFCAIYPIYHVLRTIKRRVMRFSG